MRSLSEFEDSQSVKTDKGELIDCGSTADGLHLILGDLRRADSLRRYARLRSCSAVFGDKITLRGLTLLAHVRPVDSKGKLFKSFTTDKIGKRKLTVLRQQNRETDVFNSKYKLKSKIKVSILL